VVLSLEERFYSVCFFRVYAIKVLKRGGLGIQGMLKWSTKDCDVEAEVLDRHLEQSKPE
jgi:hypothetical protein